MRYRNPAALIPVVLFLAICRKTCPGEDGGERRARLTRPSRERDGRFRKSPERVLADKKAIPRCFLGSASVPEKWDGDFKKWIRSGIHALLNHATRCVAECFTSNVVIQSATFGPSVPERFGDSWNERRPVETFGACFEFPTQSAPVRIPEGRPLYGGDGTSRRDGTHVFVVKRSASNVAIQQTTSVSMGIERTEGGIPMNCRETGRSTSLALRLNLWKVNRAGPVHRNEWSETRTWMDWRTIEGWFRNEPFGFARNHPLR